ncbi:hypothetical protein PSPO01_12196 [Paraphaeosphaeria sporulosa]
MRAALTMLQGSQNDACGDASGERGTAPDSGRRLAAGRQKKRNAGNGSVQARRSRLVRFRWLPIKTGVLVSGMRSTALAPLGALDREQWPLPWLCCRIKQKQPASRNSRTPLPSLERNEATGAEASWPGGMLPRLPSVASRLDGRPTDRLHPAALLNPPFASKPCSHETKQVRSCAFQRGTVLKHTQWPAPGSGTTSCTTLLVVTRVHAMPLQKSPWFLLAARPSEHSIAYVGVLST